MAYLKRASTPKSTPQSEPIPGSDQVPNSAGGFAWEVDNLTRLRRFLILGSEGGSYYASERSLTKENLDGVRAAIKEDGIQAVDEIVRVSVEGRAPKQDPAIYALALASVIGDDATRKRALGAVNAVCRTGWALFRFAEFRQAVGGWGRGVRRAVGRWYTEQPADRLAYQLVKYKQREGWSHRDLLRLSHPIAPTPEHNALFAWATDKDVSFDALPGIVQAAISVHDDPTTKTVLDAIVHHRLPREALPSEALSNPDIWEALLATGMPMTAMIRNLGNMSKVGLLKPFSEATKVVVNQLGNADEIRKARVHPIQILSALRVYESGQGARGSGIWTPVPQVVSALDAAFYLAFGNVEPTGKNIMLALDVSSSMMWGQIAGIPGLTPAEAATAMALVTAKTEPNYFIFGFAHTFRELSITSSSSLREAMGTAYGGAFGGTDCALPMKYADAKALDVDSFFVYTDGETWYGDRHPKQALDQYRRAGHPDARSAIVAMVANPFSIADPNDSGMLDVVGFDTSTPTVLSEFTAGRL